MGKGKKKANKANGNAQSSAAAESTSSQGQSACSSRHVPEETYTKECDSCSDEGIATNPNPHGKQMSDRSTLDMSRRSAFLKQRPFAPAREPGMFADTALFSHALLCYVDTTKINLFGKRKDFYLPSLLAFEHSILLDLDDEMQGYADAFFCHWYLVEAPKLTAEQRKQDKILAMSFDDLRSKRDGLYLPQKYVSKEAHAELARLFQGPITFSHLVTYRYLFQANESGIKFGIDEARVVLEQAEKPKLTPLAEVQALLDEAKVQVARKQAEERAANTDPAPELIRGVSVAMAIWFNKIYPGSYPEVAHQTTNFADSFPGHIPDHLRHYLQD